jgi:type II secretory pathway predicted ATPase ExeA
MIMYRQRFSLMHHPVPKDAQGKTFFDKAPGYVRLKRGFLRLRDDGGLGVVTAEAGVGKTASLRNLCHELPKPDYLVLYLCDTAVSPLDLYRTLAVELGVRPSHRRAQLWTDIKKALVHMVDERGTSPVIVIDEAQHLSDKFLIDLSGFLNFTFDSRDLLTLWLAGLTPLRKHLQMQAHAALKTRVSVEVHLDPLDREVFGAFIDHGLKAAGATSKLLSEPALELLFRASRGLPRVASKLLRAALRAAHEKDQSFVDEHVLDAAIEEISLPAVGKP